MPAQVRMRFGFDIFVILFFSYAAWDALDFRTLARYLPLTVSVLALILSFLALAIDYRNWKRSGNVVTGEVSETAAMYSADTAEPVVTDKEDSAVPGAVDHGVLDDADEPAQHILRRAGIMVLWTLGYVLAIWIIGLVAATGLFLVAYLFLEARAGWKIPIIGTVLVLAGMAILRELLNLEWPDYVLQRLWA